MRIEVLMFDGIAEADVLLAQAVLMKARHAGADIEPMLVTADGRPEVVGCYDTRFGGLVQAEPARAAAFVVAGGWIDEIIADGELTAFLTRAKATNPHLVLAGICSGSLFLGAAGLLEGRTATTYDRDVDILKQWCDVVDARIVDDGDVVTTGSGWLSGLDLALYLIERELERPYLAIDIEQRIGHDRRGTVWRTHRASSRGSGRES